MNPHACYFCRFSREIFRIETAGLCSTNANSRHPLAFERWLCCIPNRRLVTSIFRCRSPSTPPGSPQMAQKERRAKRIIPLHSPRPHSARMFYAATHVTTTRTLTSHLTPAVVIHNSSGTAAAHPRSLFPINFFRGGGWEARLLHCARFTAAVSLMSPSPFLHLIPGANCLSCLKGVNNRLRVAISAIPYKLDGVSIRAGRKGGVGGG